MLLHASSTEWKNKFIFEIFGTKGRNKWFGKKLWRETLTFYKMSKKWVYPKEYTLFPKIDNSWKLELEEFYQDIIRKRISIQEF